MTTATVRAQQPTNPVAALIKSSVWLMMVFIALVIIYAYFMFTAPNFAQAKIFIGILLQTACVGVMALGMTFTIATASTDPSVGTGMTLAAVTAGVFLSADWMSLPLGVGLILVFFFGVFVGLINNVNISILGLPPFTAAFVMMVVTRGLTLIISDKSTTSITNRDYIALSIGSFFPAVRDATLMNATLIFVLLTILATFLPSKTLLDRYALTIGSNEEAMRPLGVNIHPWKVIIYVVAGVFMAIGAILYSARLGFVQPAEGVGFELNVVVATVIGGTSLSGGHASVPGALLGALIIEILKKGLTIMGIAPEWQLVVTGVVILPAVFIDNIRRAHENAA